MIKNVNTLFLIFDIHLYVVKTKGVYRVEIYRKAAIAALSIV